MMNMKSLRTTYFLLLLLIAVDGPAQVNMQDYEGHWEGAVPNDSAFSATVSIRKVKPGTAVCRLLVAGNTANKTFTYQEDQPFVVPLGGGIVLKGIYQQQRFDCFMQAGRWLYHLSLVAMGKDQYQCKWNILLVDHFRSLFLLSIENGYADQYEAYAFCTDKRWAGFACYNFTKKDQYLHFNDFRSGLEFEGVLAKDTIALTIKSAGLLLTKIFLHRSAKDWNLNPTSTGETYRYHVPQHLPDGIVAGDIHQDIPALDETYLQRMVDSIHAGAVTNTHSVLIARKGKLVYEQYFEGFNSTVPHDQRSAAKSISSALIGIAIDKGILHDTGQKLFSLLPPEYRDDAKSDPRKAAISIASLLTMSSGLDAVDFGIDRKSVASEDEYQNTTDWLRTVTAAPMINQPGAHALYSSANPFLLGVILNHAVAQPLEYFIHQQLFAPLQINNYIIQNDCFNQPYFGGGMLLTPRDMLKFGLLYANHGQWKGRQVISKSWIDASFKKYLVLENHREKNEYGFLWWHYQYTVGNKTIASIEARGAGGQYIFIIPAYELVVVITSGNFRNGRVWQPEKILEQYILPAIVGK
jgi:CubicO group peptidase (beta-lactamase class C family)